MRLGPQTGARDGMREIKAVTELRGLRTGSRVNDEEKRRAAAAKKAEKLARKQAKAGKR